jgi:hypothetical protein
MAGIQKIEQSFMLLHSAETSLSCRAITRFLAILIDAIDRDEK